MESGIFKGIFSEKTLNVMYPERSYPKWEKMEIKRKYGKHPAIYLDIWQPYLKSIFELMPRIRWTREDFLHHEKQLKIGKEWYEKAMNKAIKKISKDVKLILK